jgi:hypothetical protein
MELYAGSRLIIQIVNRLTGKLARAIAYLPFDLIAANVEVLPFLNDSRRETEQSGHKRRHRYDLA